MCNDRKKFLRSPFFSPPDFHFHVHYFISFSLFVDGGVARDIADALLGQHVLVVLLDASRDGHSITAGHETADALPARHP